jgi:hypothetical protein
VTLFVLEAEIFIKRTSFSNDRRDTEKFGDRLKSDTGECLPGVLPKVEKTLAAECSVPRAQL